MGTVYVVTWVAYDDWHLIGVYDNAKLANEVAACWPEGGDVVPFELNDTCRWAEALAHNKQREHLYFVACNRDDITVNIEAEPECINDMASREAFRERVAARAAWARSGKDPGALVEGESYVWACDKDSAAQIVRGWRDELIADGTWPQVCG